MAHMYRGGSHCAIYIYRRFCMYTLRCPKKTIASAGRNMYR